MPWFKVDDKLHDHRKARAAGATAMGVWLLAGSWAADNLTDGFVPASVLPRWGRQREATRLVEVGLWHADEQDGEKGWRFHEWAERQPTRAQKLEERAVRAAAGRKGGRASGASRREAKQEANAKQVASPLLEPPSRPDPNPTNTSGGADKPPATDPTAQTLVATWLDLCTERPPGRVIGQVAREVKTMLGEGIDPKRVAAGLAEWHRKGLHPSALASVVHEVSKRTAAPVSQLPHVSELELPPDGLSPDEYAEWEYEQRQRRQARRGGA